MPDFNLSSLVHAGEDISTLHSAVLGALCGNCSQGIGVIYTRGYANTGQGSGWSPLNRRAGSPCVFLMGMGAFAKDPEELAATTTILQRGSKVFHREWFSSQLQLSVGELVRLTAMSRAGS